MFPLLHGPVSLVVYLHFFSFEVELTRGILHKGSPCGQAEGGRQDEDCEHGCTTESDVERYEAAVGPRQRKDRCIREVGLGRKAQTKEATDVEESDVVKFDQSIRRKHSEPLNSPRLATVRGSSVDALPRDSPTTCNRRSRKFSTRRLSDSL